MPLSLPQHCQDDEVSQLYVAATETPEKNQLTGGKKVYLDSEFLRRQPWLAGSIAFRPVMKQKLKPVRASGGGGHCSLHSSGEEERREGRRRGEPVTSPRRLTSSNEASLPSFLSPNVIKL